MNSYAATQQIHLRSPFQTVAAHQPKSEAATAVARAKKPTTTKKKHQGRGNTISQHDTVNTASTWRNSKQYNA